MVTIHSTFKLVGPPPMLPRPRIEVSAVMIDDIMNEDPMDELLADVRQSFGQQLDFDSLLEMSKSLQVEMRQHLIASPQRMLPSFNYSLPSGQEQGTYLALEVGGSNLRMSLIDLHGRQHQKGAIQIRQTMSSPIDKAVRQLQDHAFFDWMAANIRQLLLLEGNTAFMEADSPPLRMGVAWSFPVEQTSIRSGNVLGMGKGFHCSDAVRGHDLGDIIEQACQRIKLNVQLSAIVNDSSSTLLARAYLDPATRIALILGTGFNAAFHIPVVSLHSSKFKSRQAPVDRSSHVLTNTEFSMFGKQTLPSTRWDDDLNAKHIMPDYQPYEYLVAGGYLGEIVRLIVSEAVRTAGLCSGELPPSLRAPYSLDTRTLALIDMDNTKDLLSSRSILETQHPHANSLSLRDLTFIRETIHCVLARSIAYFASGMHALTSLLEDLESEAGFPMVLQHISVACDGSIINKYPNYMERAQTLLDHLREHENKGRKRVVLEKTQESAVFGAGVAAAMAE